VAELEERLGQTAAPAARKKPAPASPAPTEDEQPATTAPPAEASGNPEA
jgi:hypothetical protein